MKAPNSFLGWFVLGMLSSLAAAFAFDYWQKRQAK